MRVTIGVVALALTGCWQTTVVVSGDLDGGSTDAGRRDAAVTPDVGAGSPRCRIGVRQSIAFDVPRNAELSVRLPRDAEPTNIVLVVSAQRDRVWEVPARWDSVYDEQERGVRLRVHSVPGDEVVGRSAPFTVRSPDGQGGLTVAEFMAPRCSVDIFGLAPTMGATIVTELSEGEALWVGATSLTGTVSAIDARRFAVAASVTGTELTTAQYFGDTGAGTTRFELDYEALMIGLRLRASMP